jgi:SAM-dependent methyltransferase
MEFSGERFLPRVENTPFARLDPFIRAHACQSYEHWHRYLYAAPFVAGKTVLDVASGEGYGSAFLAAHAASVYGVDLALEAIEHSRRMYVQDNLHFLQGRADAIPIPGLHRFDVIVSFETIEHLDAPTQARFAAEIKRLLKPDGVLLVSTPNRMIYSDGRKYKNEYHLHEYTKNEYIDFLNLYFKSISLYGQHVYPVSQIWSLSGERAPSSEYQMAFEDGAFRPVEADAREAVYLIAVCTDRDELAAGPGSLLIDLSEVAFQGLRSRERWQFNSLFLNTGAGFRAEEMICNEAEYCPEFTLKFTLDPSTPVRELRWDPLEQQLCRVGLRQVYWEDEQGVISQLDLGRVTSNGIRGDGASFQFETLDPMIFLPISGSVASVTIEGECVPAGEPATLAGLEQAIRSRTQELVQQAHVLEAARQELSLYEQSIKSYRHHIARQDHDLEAGRQQLDSHGRTITVLTEDLRNRDRKHAQLEQRILELERAGAALEAALQAILQSKRWILINGVRAALHLFPRLLRSTWRRVLGARRHEQRQTVAIPTRWRSLAVRSAGRNSPSNQPEKAIVQKR